MFKLLINSLIFLLFLGSTGRAQDIDSSLDNLQQIPIKYIDDIDKKIDLYSSRITSKTEKTLTKLSRWENRIKGLLEKISPETATRLFGENAITFTSLLHQLKQGEDIALQYKAPYNKYRDEVTTSLKYLAQQKDQLNNQVIKKVEAASNKMQELDTEEAKVEAMKHFIRERKKLLVDQAFQTLGNNKYLTKINKETYYYIETLKNYKEIFTDSKKAEETALFILKKIPAFQQFMQKNSQLASLFRFPNNYSTPQGIEGLQTRAIVQSVLQQQISAGGPNAQEMIQQNLGLAKSELDKLKDKLSKYGAGSGDNDIPDFHPNGQKSKTFSQRLEYGANVQFAKSTNYYPSSASLGLSIGYKLNDKSNFGLGISYKLGMGTITHIVFTHQGVGFRSFADYKIKKSLYLSGGFEMNHNAQFDNFAQLRYYDVWQSSGLVGLSKKYKVSKKVNGQMSLLYDFLAYRHPGAAQPVVFRVGYNF